MGDYAARAIEYAEHAVDKKNKGSYGKWTILAAKRFLGDLKRAKAKNPPFYFSVAQANRACAFIEQLPHVEGVWDTPTIVLHDSDIFFICQLFGFRKEDGTRRFTTALKAIARKNAKALALDTPVATPGGWSTMGDLALGDTVFGADGQPCRVTATSPVYIDHECYRLTFSNGEEVIADAGHLWITTARVDKPNGKPAGNKQTRTRVRTTQEIVDTLQHGSRRDTNHSIAMPAPLDCAEAVLPVAPYTLGAWLGDGHSAGARLTCDRNDIEIFDGIRIDGWPVREMSRSSGKASLFSLSNGDRSRAVRDLSLMSALRRMGVLNDKHIPAEYLRASLNQRLALLQGLMDTDGTVSKNGRVISFTGVNERLVCGVAELLASMGVKYSWRRDPLVCNGRPVPGVGHKLQFMAFRDELPVFRLRRKLDRMLLRSDCNIASRSRTVQVVAAERVQSVPVRCITVDSPNHLFLCGKTMLPTHNSTIAAGIALYCQTMEHEVGPQIIAAATTGDQARIVFKIAKRMVEKTPDLREAFGLEAFANAIASFNNGGTFKAISAKASTQDGLNPSCLILDEIHAHKNSELLDVLRSAAGARRNPLFLYATTEGYESPGPWHELRDMAKKVLSGKLVADHFLAVYYAIDDDDDDFDESCWIKANPLMDVNPILLTELRKEAIEAKAMPGKMAEFRIKRLNRQSATAQGWINFDKWKKCAKKVDLEYLKQFPCYGGLDLASTSDLCSFRLVWYVDGVYYTWGRRWVPETAVATRTTRGSVPYQSWVESGYIEQTKGEITDYGVVAAAIIEACERFNVQGIGYDQWNAAQLVAKLEAENIPMQIFIQGPKSYHPAMQEFERAYVSGNFHYGHDPVLTWNASNLVTRTDQNMNTAPDKKKSSDKIDDMVALLMAFGVVNQTRDTNIDDFINNPVIC
ncbi:MAG: hypothetical protein K6U74_00010 [Firmicutes bacterium]|nr:hypothetical protein [Bacillota bacterium]